MTQTTLSPITEIKNQFPQAVYFTPSMISTTVHLSRQQVYRYCRQLWPRHEGHYRFWDEEINGNNRSLDINDLQKLLRLIQQNHRK
jgi:hypothetical protein